jgi:hypothetical protein
MVDCSYIKKEPLNDIHKYREHKFEIRRGWNNGFLVLRNENSEYQFECSFKHFNEMEGGIYELDKVLKVLRINKENASSNFTLSLVDFDINSNKCHVAFSNRIGLYHNLISKEDAQKIAFDKRYKLDKVLKILNLK